MGGASRGALFILCIISLHSVLSQPSILSDDTSNSTCPITIWTQFRALEPIPEPTCPFDAPHNEAIDEFLSFEDWKSLRMSEYIPTHPPDHGSLGSDDFRVSSSQSPDSRVILTDSSTSRPSSEIHDSTPPPHDSPKASRVPLTDRFNYASLDCSARITKAHRSAKQPQSILNHKRDKYMLSPCSAQNKFIIVELCDDIMIDTIQLANFEFFSGVFKDIRISVAQTYSPDEFVEVLTTRAANIRAVQSFQSFHFPEDKTFYRYIRIDFLTHYGTQYYCPVSLLRVYGLTQMEEYKWDEWQAAYRAELEARLYLEASVVVPLTQSVVTRSVTTTATTSSPLSLPTSAMSGSSVNHTHALDPIYSINTSDDNLSRDSITDVAPTSTLTKQASHATLTSDHPLVTTSYNIDDIERIVDSIMTTSTPPPESSTPTEDASHANTTPITPSPTSSITADVDLHPPLTTTTSAAGTPELLITTIVSANSDNRETSKSLASSMNVSVSTDTQSSAPPSLSSSFSPTPSAPKATIIKVATQSSRPATTTLGAGGESVYRTIMNRLSILENDSSLSVRYVEDQARSLRHALKRLEQNLGRLESISTAQQHTLKKIVTEFQQHKRNMESERIALLSRVNSLSDEIVLERRLGIAQLCLLLTVLVFITFTRGASHTVATRADDGGRGTRPNLSWRSSARSLDLTNRKERAHQPPGILLPPPLSSTHALQAEQGPSSSITASNPTSALHLPLQTPFHIPSPRFVNIGSSSSGAKSPFMERLDNATSGTHSPLDSVQSPNVGLGTPFRTHSQPLTPSMLALVQKGEYFPRHVESSLNPHGTRKPLGKTAHLHEVKNARILARRRVNSGGHKHKEANGVENRDVGGEGEGDVFGGGGGGVLRNANRSRSRSLNHNVRRARTGSVNGSGLLNSGIGYNVKTPERTRKGSLKGKVDIGETPTRNRLGLSASIAPSSESPTRASLGSTASGSDTWEDTSDDNAGDSAGTDDV